MLNLKPVSFAVIIGGLVVGILVRGQAVGGEYSLQLMGFALFAVLAVLTAITDFAAGRMACCGRVFRGHLCGHLRGFDPGVEQLLLSSGDPTDLT